MLLQKFKTRKSKETRKKRMTLNVKLILKSQNLMQFDIKSRLFLDGFLDIEQGISLYL